MDGQSASGRPAADRGVGADVRGVRAALPAERHPTSLDPGWTHAYFDTGVVFAPGDRLEALHDRWLHFHPRGPGAGRVVQQRFLPRAIEPLILHHHHQIAGGLRPTGYDAPDRVIRRVNAELLGTTSAAPVAP